MKKFPLPGLIALLGCMLLGSPAARAGDIKFPEKTDPAFLFKVADDVVSNTDESGNLIVQFPKKFGLSLTMVDLTPELLKEMKESKDGLADLAKAAFETAQAQSNGKTEPAEIAGKKGAAFFASKDMGSMTINFKLIFVRVDEKHLASIGVVTPTTISAEDKEFADKLVQSFKFTKGE